MKCLGKCAGFVGVDEVDECIFNNEADICPNTFWIEVTDFNEEYCRRLVDTLLTISLDTIKDSIKDCDKCSISAKNIPQFSNYEDGTVNVLRRLRMAGDFGPTYAELGEQFTEPGKKESAYKKYGENHAKTAELLGLVEIRKESRCRVYLTQLGRVVESYSEIDQISIIKRLIIRIPIIKSLIKEQSLGSDVIIDSLSMYLSPSTARRRKSNVERLLKVIDVIR